MKDKTWKVLHFIDSDGVYGAERVVLNLSKMMADSGRYQPLIGCIVSRDDAENALYDEARALGLPAEKLVIRNSWLLFDLPRAARQLRNLGVQLVHSHGYKPSVFGYVMSLMHRFEIMATYHLWFVRPESPLKTRMMTNLELILLKSFGFVVGVSEPIVKSVVSRGVPVQKARVIENGVEVGKGAVAAPEAINRLRQELALGDGEFCVLNSARLTHQKAQKDIIAAAAILHARGIKVRFLIVGEGELRDELQAQIQAAGLGEVVTLLGFRADMSALLEIADLFTLPSVDEGMPMSLLEAAAAGLPVVVSPVGDIPRLIEDHVSGLIVPTGAPPALAEAISTLIENPELGRSMGAAARQRIHESYSTEAMFAKYDQVYAELLR